MELIIRILDTINQTQSGLNDGLVGALLGALIGGALALYGSVWVMKRQAKAQAEKNRRETIYKPLYNELMNIQGHILQVNPFPRFIAFKKGAQTIQPHPQYSVWGEIELDTRILETPKALIAQMKKLYLGIEEYLKASSTAREEVRHILNEALKTYNQEACSIINVGDILIPCVFENNGNDIYDTAMRYAETNIDVSTKGKINATVYQNCCNNQLMVDAQKKYNEYGTAQQEAIAMLGKLVRNSKGQY